MLENILENSRLMVIETENQVKLVYDLVSEVNLDLLERIASKDDYIDNLKTTIENDAFSYIHQLDESVDKRYINEIRAIHIICVNLERIADYCVNIARQVNYLSEPAFIHQFDFHPFFDEIKSALPRITQALKTKDLYTALHICKSEFVLDEHYKESFKQILKQINNSRYAENLITVIFMFRYLERIGDSLLNIGEALIFAIIGDRIKIRQVEALQNTLQNPEFNGSLLDFDVTSIWGSRSGCRISRIEDTKPSGFKAQGIFKEGALKKIQEENEKIEKWQEIAPGLLPQVFGYHEKENTASLLVEFLPGCTVDQVILTETEEIIRLMLELLEKTIVSTWTSTRVDELTSTDYMNQLKSRYSAVRNVHPGFDRKSQGIGKLSIRSTQELIKRCQGIETQYPAPFSVFIHGDFNANNIIFNSETRRINYIDPHRSKDADYIQDASVFLISLFRLPVFDTLLRNRLNQMIHHFFQFFKRFAAETGDETFDTRLGLALARSLFTSSRFELKKEFAGEMCTRSNYLMERILEHHVQNNSFSLSDEILLY